MTLIRLIAIAGLPPEADLVGRRAGARRVDSCQSTRLTSSLPGWPSVPAQTAQYTGSVETFGT